MGNKVLARQFWPAERYPICFHAAVRDGAGLWMKEDLPWTLKSTRIRFYQFLRALKDDRTWTVEVLKDAIRVSVVPGGRKAISAALFQARKIGPKLGE